MPRLPPRNKALLSDNEPLVSLNKALLGPYFLGGVALGGPLWLPWLLFCCFFRFFWKSYSESYSFLEIPPQKKTSVSYGEEWEGFTWKTREAGKD